MNTNQTPVQELALILHGLEAVYVADMETTRQKLIRQISTEMEKRGVSKFDSAETK